MTGIQQLEALEVFLRGWSDELPAVAERAAGPIQADARAKYSAGNDCFGNAMPPRKVDGARALARPLSTVTFAAVGATIVGSAENVLRYHQGPIFTAPYPRRQTFPGDGDPLPAPWEKIIADSAESVLTEAVKEAL